MFFLENHFWWRHWVGLRFIWVLLRFLLQSVVDILLLNLSYCIGFGGVRSRSAWSSPEAGRKGEGPFNSGSLESVHGLSQHQTLPIKFSSKNSFPAASKAPSKPNCNSSNQSECIVWIDQNATLANSVSICIVSNWWTVTDRNNGQFRSREQHEVRGGASLNHLFSLRVPPAIQTCLETPFKQSFASSWQPIQSNCTQHGILVERLHHPSIRVI